MLNLRVSAVVLGLTLAVAGSAFTSAGIDGPEVASQWLYMSGDPTESTSYEPGSLSPCSGQNEVCGIIAQEDLENPGYPLITDDHRARIEQKDDDAQDVFLKN